MVKEFENRIGEVTVRFAAVYTEHGSLSELKVKFIGGHPRLTDWLAKFNDPSAQLSNGYYVYHTGAINTAMAQAVDNAIAGSDSLANHMLKMALESAEDFLKDNEEFGEEFKKRVLGSI